MPTRNQLSEPPAGATPAERLAYWQGMVTTTLEAIAEDTAEVKRSIVETKQELKEQLEGIYTRLRSIENYIENQKGKVVVWSAVVSTIVGLAVAILTAYITKGFK